MFDLKVQTTRQPARDHTTVGRRGFDLCFVPADWLPSLSRFGGRITVSIFKIVRQCKEQTQSQTARHAQQIDMCKGRPGRILVKWIHHIGEQMEQSQGKAKLGATGHPCTIQSNSDILGPAILDIPHFGQVERGRMPISRQD